MEKNLGRHVVYSSCGSQAQSRKSDMASCAGRGRRRAREERGHRREGMYAYLGGRLVQEGRGTGLLIVASCGQKNF